MAASATFALKVGVWFRRGRLFMVSPDSLRTACPLSGRNSTYRPVQISDTSSRYTAKLFAPHPIKGFGPISLGAIIGALAVKLIVAEDEEQLQRVRSRLVKRKARRHIGEPVRS
jgi:hypothetical protein